MKHRDFPALRAFYEQQLFEDILPFWMQRGIDHERGGFFTCFSNRGDRLLHRHKFTWSQGRFVWMLAKAARVFRGKRPEPDLAEYLRHAAAGARFLMDHARLPNGHCAFILSETGEPILLGPDGAARKAGTGEFYDTSVYADSFVVYGLAEYAMAADNRRAYDFALELHDSVVARFSRPTYRSDPYPVPRGYEAHGRPMILMETAREMAEAAEHFGDARRDALLAQGRGWLTEVLDKFRDPKENVIVEMRTDDPVKRDTMLGSYVNPGHTLECAWFVILLAQRLGMTDRIPQVIDLIRTAARMGWDADKGGLFLFVHRDGGPPRGPVPPDQEKEGMIQKLRQDWDSKLWWPHSEALYATLLGYERTHAQDLLDWYWKFHEYTFRTFPNPDKAIGEWIQIRDRSGAPVDKIVALPVKDPFHITRAFILCIEVLARMERGTAG